MGLTLAAGLTLVAGCAVGPEFHQPAPPETQTYTSQPLANGAALAPQRIAPGGAVAAHWWTLFGSPRLDALEDEALRANSDLRAARAALRQARELYLAQRAALWPTISLGANATRAKNSLTIAPPLSDNSEYYTLYQGQLNLSYDVDVFGGLRRQTESAAAQADSQRFEAEAAYVALTTNVASAALALAGLEDQLAATEQMAAADRRVLELTRQQQRLGQASTLDVAAVAAAPEQAEQQAAALRKQIDQQRDLLAALLGRPSSAAPTETLSLADVRLPADLPVTLPSQLVQQRPDVLAAAANLHVASAQVGVAAAARLPGFTVTGAAGGTSSELASLLAPDNALWSIAGEVSQTVFDAGALRHRQKAAEAALDQAKAQYRSTVLAALQNVADTLQGIEEDADADRRAAAAQSVANTSFQLAGAQARRGETGVLPQLTAAANLAQANVALAQTRAARYADTVALFQALGGGWWDDAQEQADGRR